MDESTGFEMFVRHPLYNYWISPSGKVLSFNANKPLFKHPFIPKLKGKQTYYRVTIYHNGKRINRYIHNLVAEVFLSPRPTSSHEINHKDGNKLNPHYANLEWVTRSENINHAYRTGMFRAARGECQGFAKLNDSQVREIRKLKGKVSVKEIAKTYKVHPTTVSNVLRNVSWGHVV